MKVCRIKKIKNFDNSATWPLVHVEYQPIQSIQSFQEPFDDLKKRRSSIWTSFFEVYEKHKQVLEGII